MFENRQTRQMNLPKIFRKKKSLSDELSLHFSSKVQNLTVFSIIYMIRIRFFVLGELIQNGFRAARYSQLPGSRFSTSGLFIKMCRLESVFSSALPKRLGRAWSSGMCRGMGGLGRSWWSSRHHLEGQSGHSLQAHGVAAACALPLGFRIKLGLVRCGYLLAGIHA